MSVLSPATGHDYLALIRNVAARVTAWPLWKQGIVTRPHYSDPNYYESEDGLTAGKHWR